MTYKSFVDVIVLTTREGSKKPLRIRFENDEVYKIDRVIQIKRCAARKVGGTGIRYTVSICGKQTYLFEDEGMWFVEAKEQEMKVN